jgi:hypothetical protein
MRSSRKLSVAFGLISFVAFGAAFSSMPQGTHKNLKVLPQDISEKSLDSIMQTFNKALSVDCKFCHVTLKVFPGGLDYAADGEPMKEEARKMLRLTMDINTKYFPYDTIQKPKYLSVVHCNTCHRGEAFPEH